MTNNLMRKSFLRITLFLNLIITILISNAQIIPEERRIDWNPGLENGIPEIIGPVKNVLDYGADNSGIENSRDAFVSAINALPTQGGVVLVPKGNYKISSTITIGKNNVVIRGEGKDSKLFMDFNGDCFRIETYQRGDWQNLNADLLKDTVTIMVQNGSKFKVGQFAEIQQDNDPGIMYTNPDWNEAWANNAVGQLLEVKSINGNLVTFKTPLHINYSASLNPQIRPQNFVKNVGFEDFYIEKLVTGEHTFSFKNAAYCWIKNVESYHTRKTHVNLNTVLGCEFRENYFHHSFSYGDGGSGYGVDCGFHATDNLIENNVFNHLRHSMMVHIGANGNVFGYNYSINNVQGEGETNLNSGWIPPDFSVHGHYPYMNLFEGNEIEEIGIGDFWGPAGIGNTFFRNKVNGDGILYYDNSDYQNVIGNITRVLKTSSGNSQFKLEHGNVVNGVVKWDNTIEDHNLPNSYYLDSVPSFFTNPDEWPVFGPDKSNNTKLPAQVWLEQGPATGAKHFNLPENNTDQKVKFFPNPTSSELYVVSDDQLEKICIYDITGRKQIEESHLGAFKIDFDLSAFDNGIYLIEVTNVKREKIIRKIIRE